MSKFCPYCLTTVDEFENDATQGSARHYTCPVCHATQSNQYVDEHDTRPRVMFSVIGLSGNGKTCYVASLFHCFDNMVRLQGQSWEDFVYVPGDEADIGRVRKAQRELEAGRLPLPNQVIFPRPLVLMLDGLPIVDRAAMMMYDTAGEVFEDVAQIQDVAKYALISSTVLCLIKLTGEKLATPSQLHDMVVRYGMAMRAQGLDGKLQTLVVIVASGDELLADPTLPASARQSLTMELQLSANNLSILDEQSSDLRAWLMQHSDNKRRMHQFVSAAEKSFGAVRFCIVSALGSAPKGDELLVNVQPRNVLAPIWWLLRTSLASVTVRDDETGAETVCFSLNSAVSQISGNGRATTLILSPSEHVIQTPIDLVGNVSLEGCDKDRTTVVGVSGQCVLRYRGGGRLKATGISFVYRGNVGSHVVVVATGGVDISHCRFRGALLGVESKHGCGLMLTGQGSARVSDCELAENGMYGVLVKARSQTRLVDNLSWKNAKSGIVLQQSNSCAVEGNRCTENQRNGIFLKDSKDISLIKNRCEDNQESGILVAGESLGRLEANACHRNKHGVVVQGTSRLTLENNVCEHNHECGIAFEEQSAGAATGNRCNGNSHGLTIGDRAAPAIDGNNGARNRSGLSIARTANPRVGKTNVFVNNGVDVSDERSVLKKGFF